MAKSYIFLQGKCKWCKHQVPETDAYGHTKWSVVLYPTPESTKMIMDLQKGDETTSGIKNKLGRDDDGYYMRFQRLQSKLIRGQNVAFPKPECRDKNNMPLPSDVLIGNGSDVTIKLEKYKHNTPTGRKAYALQWEAIKVDNLIPFTPKDFQPSENEAFKGMEKQPPQTPTF